MIGAVQNDGQRGRDVALRDSDKRVLVWLDSNLEVLDAILEDELLILSRILLGYQRPVVDQKSCNNGNLAQ